MSTSKTIAKNTFFLYVRMFLTMGVSLYTSRIVLNTLGVEDYGVYSIVGGVVVLFAFFNAAMSSATQRFLAFDIGKKDEMQLRNTFSATFFIHIAIALLILVLAETVGLWFVHYKLNFPSERADAVYWVYQFSIFTFLIGVVQVPFNALIIAREKMNIYAIMSIVEVLLKLLIVYLLVLFNFDKLKLYSLLVFAAAVIVAALYRGYCYRNFQESKLRWYYDKVYFKKLVAYSGWNLFGNIAGVAKGQGINVVLNLFFGPLVNAAYGIMLQVQSAVNSFVSNFQLAVNPQIVKSYAKGEINRTSKLIFQSSKFSYFLMFLISTPILYNIDYILHLWLKKPPDHATTFVQLCLINILIDCVSGPLMVGAQATGEIKWYQIIVGSLVFLNLPFSYLFLKLSNNPNYIFYVSIFISLVTLNFRLYFLKINMGISMLIYYKDVVLKLFLISITTFILLYYISTKLTTEITFVIFLIESILIVLLVLIFIFLIGMDRYERKFLGDIIKQKTSK